MWNFSAPQIMVQALIDINYSRLNSFIHHLLITHSFFDYNLSIYRHVLCFSLDQNIKGKLKIFLVYIFSIPKQEGKFSLKLTFSEKATKIDKIFNVNLTVCSNRQIHGEDFVNFCGPLRKHEL